MSIPERQLQTWSNLGAQEGSAATYSSINDALKRMPRVAGKNSEVYLQGSYANHTNIRGDSDVDIVAELKWPAYGNGNSVSAYQPYVYAYGRDSAEVVWREFRDTVVRVLNAKFPGHVDSAARRCVRVNGRSGRLSADVVVCLTYHKKVRNPSYSYVPHAQGIAFIDTESKNWIVNFPKLHRENGSAKNQSSRTLENFKPTIRMFKNARNNIIQRGALQDSTAPSYFIECLLYNVPDPYFRGSCQDRYEQIVSWLYHKLQNGAAQSFECQNKQSRLFGDTFVQWNPSHAKALVLELWSLWKNFR